MPTVQVRGANYFYQEAGSGTETIVFAHGFLMNGDMFQPQIEALQKDYRCIAFDWRGQGRSEATPDGYDMDELYLDALELLEKLNAIPCHWVGLSMGGFVGIRIGARKPELLKSLVLAETSAEAEDPRKMIKWKTLAYIFRFFGVGPVKKPITKTLFGQKILNDPSRQDVVARFQSNWDRLDKAATMKTAMAIFHRKSVVEELPKISVPTLIITGDQDIARTSDEAKRMKDLIPNSQLVVIPGAGHSSSIEEPESFTNALKAFWKTLKEESQK
ncbi:MAG: alpha/beta hydrolase [Calditrichaeota bacterium]|nr:alpha/beta hydrolase [Calditrichota bacterium]